MNGEDPRTLVRSAALWALALSAVICSPLLPSRPLSRRCNLFNR